MAAADYCPARGEGSRGQGFGGQPGFGSGSAAALGSFPNALEGGSGPSSGGGVPGYGQGAGRARFAG